MPGKDVSVETGDAPLPQVFQCRLAHRLGHSHLTGVGMGEHQSDRADLCAPGLRQEGLDPAQQEAEGHPLDLPHPQVGVRIAERRRQGVLEGLGEAVGQRPHGMEIGHLVLQEAVHLDQLGKVGPLGLPRRHFHSVSAPRPNRRPSPQRVTSHIASATMGVPIFDVPR